MNLLQKIFSVRNEQYHKIIYICGLKLKFRRLDYNNGNMIILVDKTGKEQIVKSNYFKGLRINLSGNSNLIRIHEPYNFSNCILSMSGSSNYFEIHKSSYALNKVNFNIGLPGNNRKVIIGENFSVGGETLLINNINNGEIIVGDDCMFSAGIHIRVDDGHVICKKGSTEILNKGGFVYIGNHVWLGRHVFINKNTKVSDNSVVGANSIVTKAFEETNVVLAGNPAKIIKRDIEWHRQTYNDFMTELSK